jgi:hypothetical protein
MTCLQHSECPRSSFHIFAINYFKPFDLIMMDDAGLNFREHAQAQTELVQLAMLS